MSRTKELDESTKEKLNHISGLCLEVSEDIYELTERLKEAERLLKAEKLQRETADGVIQVIRQALNDEELGLEDRMITLRVKELVQNYKATKTAAITSALIVQEISATLDNQEVDPVLPLPVRVRALVVRAKSYQERLDQEAEARKPIADRSLDRAGAINKAHEALDRLGAPYLGWLYLEERILALANKDSHPD